MLADERRRKVFEIVKAKGFIGLAELAVALGRSESTVRRDLDYWDRQGLLKRTHGGAMFTGDGSSLPALEDRSTTALEEKRQIARAAAARVKDGDAVLLDGGTTTLEVAKQLLGRTLQVVTNSLPIAHLFASSREADLVMLGGYVYPRTGVALGPLTVQMMQGIHVHHAFLSVGGITAKGFFNSNLLLVETEQQMMKCADEVVVVADHSKIARQNLAFLCGLGDVSLLIVDAGITKEQRELVENAGARLLVAGQGTGA